MESKNWHVQKKKKEEKMSSNSAQMSIMYTAQ